LSKLNVTRLDGASAIVILNELKTLADKTIKVAKEAEATHKSTQTQDVATI
jgi:hypothetical protein